MTACALGACGPGIQLAPSAEPIQLLSGAPTGLLESYVLLGAIECSKGSNARHLETNIRQCHNYLRNRTSALGGDVVVITSQALGPGECGNCVIMFANAYRRRP